MRRPFLFKPFSWFLRRTEKQHGISLRFFGGHCHGMRHIKCSTQLTTWSIEHQEKPGTRQVAWQHGWPLQLLLGCSRVVTRRPCLQLLHGCITLLAHHLKEGEIKHLYPIIHFKRSTVPQLHTTSPWRLVWCHSLWASSRWWDITCRSFWSVYPRTPLSPHHHCAKQRCKHNIILNYHSLLKRCPVLLKWISTYPHTKQS